MHNMNVGLTKDDRLLSAKILKISHDISTVELRPWKLQDWSIKVITKLPNSEQSYKGKVQTHNYINRQNQSTTGKL